MTISSACVCHTNEWCFYCEMYVPLLDERDDLLHRNGRQEKIIRLLLLKREHLRKDLEYLKNEVQSYRMVLSIITHREEPK